MASSGDAVLTLKARLSRANYALSLISLDVRPFLLQCYPSLEVKEAEICDNEGVSKWVIVCSPYYARVEG